MSETADHPYGAPRAMWVANAGKNIVQRFVLGPATHDSGPRTLDKKPSFLSPCSLLKTDVEVPSGRERALKQLFQC